MTELYRVGNHQPQNLYRGDQYIGVMFDPADAAMIVRYLNRQFEATTATATEAEPFRDGEGGIWRWDHAAGGYNLSGDGQASWTLDEIKAAYGTWGDNAS